MGVTKTTDTLLVDTVINERFLYHFEHIQFFKCRLPNHVNLSPHDFVIMSGDYSKSEKTATVNEGLR